MRVIQPQPLIGLASRSPRVGPGMRSEAAPRVGGAKCGAGCGFAQQSGGLQRGAVIHTTARFGSRRSLFVLAGEARSLSSAFWQVRDYCLLTAAVRVGFEPRGDSRGQRGQQASGARVAGFTCLRSGLRPVLVLPQFRAPVVPLPVTADWVGEYRVPTAFEGPERIGGKASGKAQDSLAPGRVNGETRRALPLLAAPGVCPWPPDAKDPVSCFVLTGRHGPPPGGWLCSL
jgi:hypothetical protein